MASVEGGAGRIGTDEWVEQADERHHHGGPFAGVRRRLEATPYALRLLLVAAVASLVPFVLGSEYGDRVAVNTLLLVMLALGLNVVVGWAGLLDLGYIAFYGFGAYGYALVSSDQIGVHMATILALPLIALATGLLGLLLGLPSRRLMGDYLAIVTLFFGQVFVEVVVNLNRVTLPGAGSPIDITGGPDGITGVDPFSFFGHELIATKDYYYFLLGSAAVLVLLLHNVDRARIGRAWRALREDSFAAGFVTVPANRLKLLAFSVGAAIAGFTGSVFSAVQIGVFPENFQTTLLINIYAAVILGGFGSMTGVIVGAIVVSLCLELLRDPGQASFLFYLVLLGLTIGTIRPWRRLVAYLGGLAALGLLLNLLVGAIVPAAVAGGSHSGGLTGAVSDAWLILPGVSPTVGKVAFVVLILAVLGLTHLKGDRRLLATMPVIYLAGFVWEEVLVLQPTVTRLLLMGAVLIAIMSARPEGLFGKRQVEIV